MRAWTHSVGYSGASMYRTFSRLNDQLLQRHRMALPPVTALGTPQMQYERTLARRSNK